MGQTQAEIDLKTFAERITANIEQVIVGKRQAVELAGIGLLGGGRHPGRGGPGGGTRVRARPRLHRSRMLPVKRATLAGATFRRGRL